MQDNKALNQVVASDIMVSPKLTRIYTGGLVVYLYFFAKLIVSKQLISFQFHATNVVIIVVFPAVQLSWKQESRQNIYSTV